MKDNKKRTYSLTAKERKEKQRSAILAEAKLENTSAVSDTAIVSAEEKRQKRSKTVIAIIASVAAALILVAIFVPALAFIVNPYRLYDDVIARFRLSNGMTLEYVIDEENYDIAATNFIFLAKNKYFDNTVFFDAQNGWLRFGGYEDQPTLASTTSSDYNRTNHKAKNPDYVNSFKALPNDSFKNPMNKFNYHLNADSKGTNKDILNQAGVLTFLYNNTTTEFQFSYREQAVNDITSVDGTQTVLSPTMVGYPLGDTAQTVEKLWEIADTAKLNDKITSGYLWQPPTPNIMIESVRVYNLDRSKWKKMDFMAYIRSEGRLNYWSGEA